MTSTVVDRLHSEFAVLLAHLGLQPSLRSTAEDSFRKSLLLAAASYFEIQVIDALLSFVRKLTGGDNLVSEFVRRKALSRQYHTLFDWDANNANHFFQLFGEPFKRFMRDEVRSNPKLARGVEAFLEIGRERNRLVHQDFGSYTLEKTSEEIYELYRNALEFVSVLGDKLIECSARSSATHVAHEEPSS